jgi:hypothetical protein
MKFPKPWRAEFCGDCYRVFDANDRQLFIIFDDEDEEAHPANPTVFNHGTPDEQEALADEIERMFKP